MCGLILILLMAGQLVAGSVELYVEDNEIWLGNAPHLKQLTHDGRQKDFVTFSPSRDALAYVEGCDAGGCSPKLVFLDLNGKELYRFQPLNRSDGKPCIGGLLQFDWIDRDRIGFSCHMNPSLSEYSVMSIRKAAPIAGYFGGPFVWSPNAKLLAYGGPVMHFAPPSAKSDYVCVGDRQIYPANFSAKNCNPLENRKSTELKGTTYVGIHGLSGDLAWRPDSGAVAFVERLYDWTPPEPSALNGGEEVTKALNLVVAPLNGPAFQAALGLNERGSFKVRWTDAAALELDRDGAPPRSFRVTAGALIFK